jgi:hypothetical protein
VPSKPPIFKVKGVIDCALIFVKAQKRKKNKTPLILI